jgi:FtsP/CotA-like multicopper oxidase with cupredoxin domain
MTHHNASTTWLGFSLLTFSVLPALAFPLRHPPTVHAASDALEVHMRVGMREATIEGFGRVKDMFLYNVNGTGFRPAPATMDVGASSFLNIRLSNELPCGLTLDVGGTPHDLSSTNLHTHGMIVPPTNPKGAAASPLDRYAKPAYGDYALVAVSPNTDCAKTPSVSADPHAAHAGHGNSAAGATLTETTVASTTLPLEAGRINYRIRIPADHPDGLAWYHPHLHGTSGTQMGSGLAGLMTVGDFWNYAFVECSGNPSADAQDLCATNADRRKEAEQRRKVDLHPLVLKDFQVRQIPSSPGRPSGWAQVHDGFMPDLCDDSTVGMRAQQTSAADLNRVGASCTSAAHPDARWLFTVNGQLRPRITVGAGRHHVWRVANMGANMTHRLELVVNEGGTLIAVPLQVLSNDGVAVTQRTRTRSSVRRGDMRQPESAAAEPLLVMPAARTELLVDMDAVCRAYAAHALRCPRHREIRGHWVSWGMRTGTEKSDGSPSGDAWPTKVLADVSFAASPERDANFGLSVVASHIERGRRQGYSPQEVGQLNQAACTDGGLSSTLDASHFRLIGLRVTEDDQFQMAALSKPEYLLTNGRARLPGAVPTFATDDYQSFNMASLKPSLCVGVPDIFGERRYQEIWIIRNDSKEIHNFHLHQSKFEVLDVKRSKDYPAPVASSAGTAAAVSNATQPASRPLLNLGAPGPGKLIDTYPIDVDGVIMLRVTFDQPEQLGTYVFHCHILEHEDKGMMSLIQVLNLNKASR